jgi:hypothetical protein
VVAGHGVAHVTARDGAARLQDDALYAGAARIREQAVHSLVAAQQVDRADAVHGAGQGLGAVQVADERVDSGGQCRAVRVAANQRAHLLCPSGEHPYELGTHVARRAAYENHRSCSALPG